MVAKSLLFSRVIFHDWKWCIKKVRNFEIHLKNLFVFDFLQWIPYLLILDEKHDLIINSFSQFQQFEMCNQIIQWKFIFSNSPMAESFNYRFTNWSESSICSFMLFRSLVLNTLSGQPEKPDIIIYFLFTYL